MIGFSSRGEDGRPIKLRSISECLSPRNRIFHIGHLFTLIATAGLLLCQPLRAQSPTSISPGLSRLEGTDPENHVDWVRIFLTRTPAPGDPSFSGDPTPPPTLTAQCTRQPSGKLGFELFANFGGIDDFAYHRPWLPIDGGLFPPVTQKVSLKMEFLGYTRVKPVKRQWELVDHPHGQLRYNNPSLGSANMEEIAYYLQYLKSLPTLRLTWDSHSPVQSADFLTTPLLAQLHQDPLCRSSGL